jgi:hypothetical protein
MRWLYFLLGNAEGQLDESSLAQGVNALRYEEPPQAWVPREGGLIRGMPERDQQMKALFEENYELKLCVGGLVQLLVSKDVVKLGEVKNLVDHIARGQHPFGLFRTETSDPTADDPWRHLR